MTRRLARLPDVSKRLRRLPDVSKRLRRLLGPLDGMVFDG
jgi:hypothetical protein